MFGTNRAPILHRHWLPTDQNEIPLDPRHLGVPSGASQMISETMVCLAQTVHLSWTDTGSQQTKTRFHMTHVTKEYHRVHPKRFLILWNVWRKPCTYLASRLAPSGASNRISKPMIQLAPTVHLSCTDTGSQQTETRFHMTHVT